MRSMKYPYLFLTFDLQKYGHFVSMLFACSSTDSAKLRYIDYRKAVLREEFAELKSRSETTNVSTYVSGYVVSRMHAEYFELMREEKAILKKMKKDSSQAIPE